MTDPVRRNDRSAATDAQAPSRQYRPGPSLEEARRGRRLLVEGHEGSGVRDLQVLLNACGLKPPLETDGEFGPRTTAGVRAFQAKYNLDRDGKVGPETINKLLELSARYAAARNEARRPAGGSLTPSSESPLAGGLIQPSSTFAPSSTRVDRGFAPEPGRATGRFGRTSASRVRQAEALLRANNVRLVEGRTYVVMIDQDSPAASASLAERQRFVHNYTGELAVFRVENGRLAEVDTDGPLRAASHAGQFTTRGFTDANGDGQSDIATLRSGVYDYRARPSGQRLNPVSDRAMKVARDFNHDGVIDAAEARRDFHATALQIHAGAPATPVSVGCQTLPPDDYARLLAALPRGRSDTFTYVLVRRPNDRTGARPW